MKKILLVVCLSLISNTAVADYRNSVDEKGCWDAKYNGHASCAYQISGELKDGKAIVKYGNKCNHRIYSTYCNEQSSGGWDCGSDGIRAGGTKRWDTYGATGRTHIKSVGSVNPSKDWVCAGEIDDWNDDPS